MPAQSSILLWRAMRRPRCSWALSVFIFTPWYQSAGDEKDREIIATRIIDLARDGLFDAAALRDRVVAEARSDVDGSPHVIRQERSPYGNSLPGAGAEHHIITGGRPSARPSQIRTNAAIISPGLAQALVRVRGRCTSSQAKRAQTELAATMRS
jgi:hypothetical protein